MKCAKDTVVSVGLILTVLTIISGMFFDQINQINAELDKRTEFVYIVPELKEDVGDIKTDSKRNTMNILRICLALEVNCE